ncbi:hypothetical protein AVEN_112534-1, partial [Araneus ventricosus]
MAIFGLALPSPNFRITPPGGHLIHEVKFNVHQVHIHGGSSVESGFEPWTLRCQETTRPMRPRRQ